eukprot:ctg_512.g232
MGVSVLRQRPVAGDTAVSVDRVGRSHHRCVCPRQRTAPGGPLAGQAGGERDLFHAGAVRRGGGLLWHGETPGLMWREGDSGVLREVSVGRLLLWVGRLLA